MKPVKTAVALKTIKTPAGPDGSTGNTGLQVLYRLTPPLKNDGVAHQFAVVSTAYMPKGYGPKAPKEPETMVFAASASGIIDFGTILYENPGEESHEKSLKNIGYDVIDLR